MARSTVAGRRRSAPHRGVSRRGVSGYPSPMSDAPDQDRDLERAERIAEEVGAENPDPVTRREAIELELEDEGLSEAGEAIGEHNE
jgi:hypothetical protein